MTWLVSAKQYIPAVIGEAWGGGYFAGYISHTQNGNPTHALIVAPRATGASGGGYTLTTSYAWKTATTTTANTSSQFDGVANTAAMVTAGIASHPAANFCVGLTIGGFSDWYLPSVLELEIAYFNLKPSTALNNSGIGINAYAVPTRPSVWTPEYPAQTSISIFNTSTQAFIADNHWSSTEAGSTTGTTFWFGGGSSQGSGKLNGVRVRAFRRIAL